MTRKKNTYPWEHDYSVAWSISKLPDGSTRMNLGRRIHILYWSPVVLFHWAIFSPFIILFACGIIDQVRDDGVISVTVLFSGPLCACLLSLCLNLTWEVAQDLFPRHLLIDHESGDCSLHILPGIRRQFRMDEVESVHILWSNYKGRLWCFIGLVIATRVRYLRLVGTLAHHSATGGVVEAQLRPFAKLVAEQLGDVHVEAYELPPRRALFPGIGLEWYRLEPGPESRV